MDTNNGGRCTHSDDEVILAASCPKKRAGRKKFKETRHPVYRGVRIRNGNRWVCEVRAPNNKTRIWLGTYPTAEMAARAHDVAALALRGRMACLNFADSAWRLRLPLSTDTRDIQKAAAEAAEAFRGEEVEVNVGETSGTKDMEMEEEVSRRDVEVRKSGGEDVLEEYMDEEEMFDMPGLLVNMAQGMLIPPPDHDPYGGGFNRNDHTESDDCEVSLWSFSI
ncbi:dehydration-responsive element-binding protein 1A-like [Amaranthus tricolor]|uniref:dehydration-responsive element-binding protein 1A-like n=1 Tax=Amaranthus tricolor TaxID=29722 RepID=UPI00258425A2|nr:dehydration-responsive element-binding protein 1A-like [Amaranthus tricolor]